MRILPNQLIPRKYAFLTKHSRRTFIIPYTYDFSAAVFKVTLRFKHDMIGASIHDMWFAKTPSITGNARQDYSPNIEPIRHTPFESLEDAYYLSCDSQYVYVNVNHLQVTSGIYHLYFHVKLYDDEFLADAVVGTPWRTTPPVGK
jgi:hypothetical protein